MPPASKTKPAAKKSKTYSKPTHLVIDFQQEVLQSQISTDSLTDAKLIAGDGSSVRIHGGILYALSPLFAKCFDDQGERYVRTRDISIPDLTLKDIQSIAQLLYTGTVFLPSQEEIDKLRGHLAFLEIDIQENLLFRKAFSYDTKPPEIPVQLATDKEPKKSKKIKPKVEPNDDQRKTRSGGGGGVQDTFKSPVPPIGIEFATPRKRRRSNTSDVEEVVYLPSAKKIAAVIPGPTPTPTPRKPEVAVVPSTPSPVVVAMTPLKASAQAQEDDCEDGVWKKPSYKDKAWFKKEARRCQYCKKKYDGAAKASECITGHSRLRCYFCFKVCLNTENLFEHFKSHHKPAGRENCLFCPYCDQTVPFKSVSCHVISIHLSEQAKQKEKEKEAQANASASVNSNANANATPTTATPQVKVPTANANTAKPNGNRPGPARYKTQNEPPKVVAVVEPANTSRTRAIDKTPNVVSKGDKKVVDKTKTPKKGDKAPTPIAKKKKHVAKKTPPGFEDNMILQISKLTPSEISKATTRIKGKSVANRTTPKPMALKGAPPPKSKYSYTSPKDGLIRMANLNETIRCKGVDGNWRIWHIKRDYSIK